MRGEGDGGALAIVLHTHMPYVEGFGTWPFGEEWLWEAMVSCYLPLVDLLREGAPLTVSITPVLCDQLQAADIAGRLQRFVTDVRRLTYGEDIAGLRAAGDETMARELERARADYETALAGLGRLGGDLLQALVPYVQWTSSATHAILPLLATEAGVRAQVRTGVASHRARFGEGWRGGFWMPECAYSPWIEPLLRGEGVRSTCIELTSRFGLGAPEHLRPIVGDGGLVLVPVDRATMDLVWSPTGYPSHGPYRDYHRHTVHHHNPWSNDGGAYDHGDAVALAREHAADFVARTRERLRRDGRGLPGGGLAVCALDTELLGHWWYEGMVWLEAVVRECAEQGLELVRLDDSLERIEPARTGRAPEGLPPGDGLERPAGEDWVGISWGEGGDLSTWSGAGVAEIAFDIRAAELEVVGAGGRVGSAAIRELLALQASDWTFMVTRGLAVPYARERSEGHLRALQRALSDGLTAREEGLGNLAIYADRIAAFAP